MSDSMSCCCQLLCREALSVSDVCSQIGQPARQLPDLCCSEPKALWLVQVLQGSIVQLVLPVDRNDLGS